MQTGLETEGHLVISSFVYVGVSSLDAIAWKWTARLPPPQYLPLLV